MFCLGSCDSVQIWNLNETLITIKSIILCIIATTYLWVEITWLPGQNIHKILL